MALLFETPCTYFPSAHLLAHSLLPLLATPPLTSLPHLPCLTLLMFVMLAFLTLTMLLLLSFPSLMCLPSPSRPLLELGHK